MVDRPSNNLVSVIIPCYNHAHFLGEAVDSVLSQTYFPVEVIIVDDGSTDEIAQIIVARPSIRYLRQDNMGLAHARNTGLSHSSGEYVLFLDADDRLLPNAIATGVHALEARRDCAFVFGPHVAIGTRKGLSNLPLNQNYDYAELLKRNFIGNPGSVLYNRWVFSVVGTFDESNSPAADYDLYLRVTRRFPIFCHHHAVVEYRKHRDNMSNDGRVMLKATLTALKNQQRHISKFPNLQEAYQAGCRNLKSSYGEPLIMSTYDALREGKYPEAMRNVYALMRFFPERLFMFATRKIKKLKSVLRSATPL